MKTKKTNRRANETEGVVDTLKTAVEDLQDASEETMGSYSRFLKPALILLLVLLVLLGGYLLWRSLAGPGDGEGTESPEPLEPMFLPDSEDRSEEVGGTRITNGQRVTLTSSNPHWNRAMRVLVYDRASSLFYFKSGGGGNDAGWDKFSVNWMPGGMAVLRDAFGRVVGWRRSDGRVRIMTEGWYDFSEEYHNYHFLVELVTTSAGRVEILPGGRESGLKVDNGETPARSHDMLRAVKNPVHPEWVIA